MGSSIATTGTGRAVKVPRFGNIGLSGGCQFMTMKEVCIHPVRGVETYVSYAVDSITRNQIWPIWPLRPTTAAQSTLAYSRT